MRYDSTLMAYTEDTSLKINGGRSASHAVDTSTAPRQHAPPTAQPRRGSVPVVCSSSTSLPEAVGDAAITFDPEKISDLLKAMNLVLGSKQLAGELRERGRQQVQCFSWQTAAKSVMGIYQEVAQAG